MRRIDRLRHLVNAPLKPLDLALVHRSALDELLERKPPAATPGLPPGAREVLSTENPRLAEYERRYLGHPAAIDSVWSAEHVRSGIELPTFRADNALVWQTRYRTDDARYGLSAWYTRLHDRLGLLERLSEDGLFGAHTVDVDGLLVSRDLLDSITELAFLHDELRIGSRATTILDIGAGYGRLAHRGIAAFDEIQFLCVDAVPLSTFLCEYYLDFRGATERARTIPLDAVAGSDAIRSVDVAVNVHSFSECPLAAIEWWLDLLAESGVSHLMIVPNTRDRLLSSERSGRRLDFMPAIRARGFELVRKRPKYGHSAFVQQHGIFPSDYFLFRRGG